jgi:predicted ArsR family transcriptional regulator
VSAVDKETFSELISSATRLRIVDLLSKRPRSLGELASSTGITVQGVLKHLDRLSKLGLIEERRIYSNESSVRKMYSLRGPRISDFSLGDLTVVKATELVESEKAGAGSLREIELLAEDALVLKRRIRAQAKKLGRAIDELSGEEQRLINLIEAIKIDEFSRLVLETAFTEETMRDAEGVLSEIHQVEDPRKTIERALAKARRSVKK